MRKLYNVLMIAAASVALAACSMDEVFEPVQEETIDLTGKTIFTATLGDGSVSTKTALLEKNEEGYYPVVWSEGDKIKVFTKGHEPVDGREFTLVSGAGTPYGTFAGVLEAEPEDGYYYAIFPYTSTAAYDGETNIFRLYLKQEQKYVPGTFDKEANPSIAITNTSDFKFKNPCGVLKVSLTGDVKVSKIVLRDDGDGVFTYGSYVFRPGDYYGGISTDHIGWGSEPSKQDFLYLICEEPVQLDAETPTDFHFVLIGETLRAGFTIEVYDENGVGVKSVKTTEDNRIHASMVREMPVIDVTRIPDDSVREGTVNLSANGTSNTYIAKPDGRTYAFDARVKGNSKFSVGDIGAIAAEVPEGSEGTLTIATAPVSVLFRTHNDTEPVGENDVIKNVTYDAVSGFIYFETNGSESEPGDCGNASIALKDVSNNILWSWQIWVTDYDPETSNEVFPNGYGAVVMDRALGALSVDPADGIKTTGLRYEWGRKDPFVTIRQAELGSFTTYPQYVFDEGLTEAGLDYSILHPTTWIPSGARWADPKVAKWNREKTEYDPCPPGWKVADPETFFRTGIFDYMSGAYNMKETDIPLGNYYDGNELYGCTMGDDSFTTFMPYGHYWTNYFEHQYTPICAIVPNCGPYGFLECYSSHMAMVRCQREHTGDAAVEEIDLSANGTANCYVVTKPGNYKFKADVKGNTNEPISTPGSVNAIWQSATGMWNWYGGYYMEALRWGSYSGAYVQYKDGYIHFKTEWKWFEGSAVISAMKDPITSDDKEALWSWHIWLTTANPEDNYLTIPQKDGNDVLLMDRNLGAITEGAGSAGPRGMLYQWGRKDPFIGAYEQSSNVPAENGAYEKVEADAETGNVKYATAHPLVIIGGNANDGVYDWSGDHAEYWSSTKKTKYDPCPPGWMVSKAISVDGSALDGSPTSYGYMWGGSKFHYTGYRHFASGTLENVGTDASYWTSDMKDDNSAYVMYFANTPQINGRSAYKAQANPVRCMKVSSSSNYVDEQLVENDGNW